MKTTLDLPDDLLRDIKIRAVRDNRKLKDAVADLLRRGLARESATSDRRRRVSLPLIRCAHRALPEDEITPRRAAAILLADEAGPRRDSLR